MLCLASPSGENVRCVSLSIILMSCLTLVVKKGWVKKFEASVSQRSVNKVSPLQKCWITEAFNSLLLWTSCYCRLTWVSVAEHREDSVRQEDFWVQSERNLPTLGAFARFSYLSCGWVYSPFLQQYEKWCGEVHREITTHPLNVFRKLTSSLTPSTERLVGKAWDHWSSLCLFCSSSVQFPYECKMFLSLKGSWKGRKLLPLKHEAGVVCIECKERATIPRMFLIVRFENPPHIIFCMLQDYLVVAVGSLMWFGDAVFPGCSSLTGCWKTHKSLLVQGQKWSPVVLQLSTAECKLQDFVHSPFVPPVLSCVATSWSVPIPICLLHAQDIALSAVFV